MLLGLEFSLDYCKWSLKKNSIKGALAKTADKASTNDGLLNPKINPTKAILLRYLPPFKNNEGECPLALGKDEIKN